MIHLRVVYFLVLHSHSVAMGNSINEENSPRLILQEGGVGKRPFLNA